MALLSQLFKDDFFVILDGGLGTTLEEVFDKNISHTPLWSSKLIEEDPEAIVQAHLSFMRVGAKIISTSTYQSSFRTFEQAGYSHEVARKIMLKSVTLASQARSLFYREHDSISRDSIRIALSLGPFGAMLVPAQEFDGFYPPPFGPKEYSAEGDNCNTFDGDESKAEASIESLAQFHLERLLVFARDLDTWNTIDFIAFETVPLAREVEAIRRAIKMLYKNDMHGNKLSSKPWWISLVFPNGLYPELEPTAGKSLSTRKVVEAALKRGAQEGNVPSGLGINCTNMQFLPGLLTELSQAVDEFRDKALAKPWLVVYPRGGGIYDPISRKWRIGEGKEERGGVWAGELSGMVRHIDRSAWSGTIVGGCCRTGPEEICALTLNLM